ncbi:MAG: riboflavin biosynthesis protein RibF [Planctomycetes bacterium RIFCSPHIGHO2_02_FULL_38_41]|nr:MAG: riboflavin biosynthesis protein RibF [Planctomycetes bacterium RIFCSPHIGHO2_02_FULL_38_41]OHB98607.1 MAG: riboflavin biosynthesis protein RibF [Planctomycetes bacterium RIFCSPLOWO2_12_38_17]
METIYGLKKLTRKINHPVVTIGMFDGVHRGHQKIIESVIHTAIEKKGESVVLTFDRHPKNAIENRPHSFITSLKHRLFLLERLCVDLTIVLEFDRKFAQITAEDFIHKILVDMLGVKYIVLGFNCHFGKNRAGDIKLVNKLASKYGYEVYEYPPVFYRGQIISSTAIRHAILDGDLEKAEGMLGRPVSILGTVVKRTGRGTTLGFPTANLDLHHEVRPPRGVYATKVRLGDRDYPALTNIGLRPTFAREAFSSEDETLEIEVHILGFQESLYGHDLEIQFLFKIRDEIKFKTSEELTAQIENDKEVLLKRVLNIHKIDVGT